MTELKHDYSFKLIYSIGVEMFNICKCFANDTHVCAFMHIPILRLCFTKLKHILGGHDIKH